MKSAINKVTGLTAGFTDKWVVSENGQWRDLTTEETLAVETEYIAESKTKLKHEIEQEIKKLLDSKAVELRYDNMMSARSYAGYSNPFQAEAVALAEWCSACWIKAGELEASGIFMTLDEAMAQMPVYTQAI